MAGHCIRHPELLAGDLVLWEAMHGRAEQGRPRQSYLSMLLKEVGNPDAGQEYMDGVIWRRSDLVPSSSLRIRE